MANINFAAAVTTAVVNGTVLTNLAEGDAITITFPNEKTFRVNSSNGVTIGKRSDGDVCDVVYRVQKYSDDDILFQSLMNQAVPSVINGTIKENFQREGIDGVGTYTLEAGSLTARPTDTRNTLDGNEVMEYTVQYRVATRNI